MINEEILTFLRQLAANNNRDWFQANKERYDRLRLAFIDEVQQLIERLAVVDPTVAGVEAKDCLYRIYRDIRFSPDKTPYKIHFAAYIAPGGRSSERGGYYLHLQPDECMLSGGIWCPPMPLLKRLRRDIYDNIDEFRAILDNPAFRQVYGGLEGETLKRMPQGYPMDSPHADIMRHKDFVVAAHKEDGFFCQPDWLDRTAEELALIHPLNEFLNYTFEE